MSPTYASGLVIVVAQVLVWLGVDVSVEALNTTVTTLVTIAAGLVVAYRRFAKGDINAFGAKA
jgi:hypothetical protein